ncbi:MAG: MgtC/SapB family protein [Clostridia bacterium]|nr:MgtC/SapB family protein [Clostridia bacterium]
MKILVDLFTASLGKLEWYDVFLRIFVAVLAGGFIGNERGKHGSAAGLRTHILVCIGACISSLTSIFGSLNLGYTGDIYRIAAQVISGIGFLGAGMIIVKNTSMITGLTTAAGLWTTGAIGIAIGFGFYVGAIIATLFCVFTAAFLTRFERQRKMSVNLYAEISEPKKAGEVFDKVHKISEDDVLIEVVPAKSGIDGNLGFFITIANRDDFQELREQIESMEAVSFVIPE